MNHLTENVVESLISANAIKRRDWWTSTLIKKLLGEPDEGGQYRLARVIAAERTAAFAEARTALAAARVLRPTQRASDRDRARAVIARLEPLRSCERCEAAALDIEREANSAHEALEASTGHASMRQLRNAENRAKALVGTHGNAHGPLATFTLMLRTGKVLLVYDAPLNLCEREKKRICGLIDDGERFVDVAAPDGSDAMRIAVANIGLVRCARKASTIKAETASE